MQNYYKTDTCCISKQIKQHKELGSIQKSKHIYVEQKSFKVIEMLILGYM